ncbi:hypothetical protein NDU88_009384 [Pleurodeles waltl]|uniref:Uncharacterized protein n=1 Tax=Pleurodeles waltl TaxID=8319 RepID=A0AAV7PSB3_PLEWA|nr:hypothetical protein NDU88_009384 [Pleurodeles waltl]
MNNRAAREKPLFHRGSPSRLGGSNRLTLLPLLPRLLRCAHATARRPPTGIRLRSPAGSPSPSPLWVSTGLANLPDLCHTASGDRPSCDPHVWPRAGSVSAE